MLHDMFQSTGKCAEILFDVMDKDSFQNIPNSSKMIIKSRCNTTIIKYTQMFEKQLDEWESSDDEYTRLLVIFTCNCRRMELFRKNVKSMDAIAIEKLYIQYLSIWSATGRGKYINVTLDVIETLYSKLSFEQLMAFRVNL